MDAQENTRVLIVEDVPVVGKMIRGLLEEQGYVIASEIERAITVTMARFDDMCGNAATLLNCADTAMYSARQAGRSRVTVID